jgi:LysR family glycine cleavage system transcriptional activator
MNGIRAFEAAARHLSFTRAAEELSVTQAAISQQIKKLESRLGIALFRRMNNQLFLTDAGQAWLPKLMRAFDLLESGIEGLRGHDNGGTLICRVPSSFSIQWLVPRLERFHVSHPAVNIRLLAMRRMAEAGDPEADIQIQNGVGTWPDVECLLLMREQVFPVCSPALLVGASGITSVESLARQTLLHVSGYRENWGRWFAAAGRSGLAVKPGLHFDQSVTAIHAAVNGFGVALGRSALVAGEIAAGRLVAPFDMKLPAKDAYWITYRKACAGRPNVQAFRDWLLMEAAEAHGRKALHQPRKDGRRP